MKRALIILLLAILLTLPAFAEEYYVEKTGMSITVPESHTIIRRATDSTRTRIKDSQIGLFVREFDEQDDYCDKDFRYLGKEDLDEILNVPDDSEVKREAIDANGLKVIKNYIYSDGKIESASYYTAIYGFEIDIYVDNATTGLTPEIEAELDGIIKNIRFDDTLKENQERQKPVWDAEAKRKKSLKYGQIIVAAILIPLVVIVGTIFMTRSVRKKRKNKIRDAIRSASVTRHCRSCGEPISETSEICPSCGTRQ